MGVGVGVGVGVVCVEPCSTRKGWVHCRAGRAVFVHMWIGIVCNDMQEVCGSSSTVCNSNAEV